MEKLGDRLKRLRLAKGMKPEEVAVAVRLSTATIYKVEANKGDVRSDKIMTLAQVLGVDPNYLLGYEDKVCANRSS